MKGFSRFTMQSQRRILGAKWHDKVSSAGRRHLLCGHVLVYPRTHSFTGLEVVSQCSHWHPPAADCIKSPTKTRLPETQEDIG